MSLHPRAKTFFLACAMIFVLLLLVILYKPALEFVEMAARELRYLWWLILLVLLGIWLVWGIGRKPKQ